MCGAEAKLELILAKCEQLLAQLSAAQEQILGLLEVLQQAAAQAAADKAAHKAGLAALTTPKREDAA